MLRFANDRENERINKSSIPKNANFVHIGLQIAQSGLSDGDCRRPGFQMLRASGHCSMRRRTMVRIVRHPVSQHLIRRNYGQR